MKKLIAALLVLVMLLSGTSALAVNSINLYSSLGRGSEGESVRRLQQRLIELGYLAAGQADGVYGAKTARAVHNYKIRNYISDPSHTIDYCTATSEMQRDLFSSSALRCIEPDVTLEILNGSYMNWESVSGNMLKFRIEVTNTSATRTIKAFELYAYTEDVWGNPLIGLDRHYYHTTTKTVKPGATVKSDYFTVEYRNQIDTIYVGVHKVIYTDGTVETIDDWDVDYAYWTYTG